MTPWNRITAVAVSAVICLGAVSLAGAAEPDGFLQTAIYEKLARSTARVVNGSASGTAWVVNHQQRLLVTNFHVVAVKAAGSKDNYRRVASHVKLVFPKFVGGKVDQNPSSYRYSSKAISAEVVGTSMRSDLALLKADSLPDDAATLKLASADPTPGARVHSVGHPRGSDAWWVYSNGTVRAISRYRNKSKFGDADFRSIETQSPVNKGDSGGAMVNDQGEVVAVVQGYTKIARLVSFSISALEVRTLINTFHKPSATNSASAHYNRAIVLFDRQEYRAAIREMDKAISLASDRSKFFFFRAHSKLELNQYSAAIADVERGLAVPNNAKPEEQDASDDSELLKKLDSMLANLRNGPSSMSYGHRVLGEIYLRRGEANNSRNDYQQSIAAFDKAVAAGSTSATVYYNRGYAKQQLDRDGEAVRDFGLCLARDPRHRKALSCHGGALLALKRYAEALTTLNRAVQVAPSDASIRIQRGNAYFHLKEYNAALVDYLQAKRLAAPNSQAYRDAVYNIQLIRQ